MLGIRPKDGERRMMSYQEQIQTGGQEGRWKAWCLVAVLAALIAIRVYAAVATVAVRTWDDSQFRASAEAGTSWVEEHGGSSGLARLVLEPKSLITEGARRAGGYLSWLVVGRRLLPALEAERAYQLVNVAFLLAQLLLVYGLFRTASRAFALAAMSLYLTMPFVFGVNRFVWTENEVMFALLALTWAGVWLLGEERTSRGGEAAAGLAAGAICALASMTREYAAPSVALVPAVIALALVLRRRFLAAATFLAPVAVYAVPFLQDIAAVASIAAEKASHPSYYHSVIELLLHSTRHVTGVPATLLVAAGVLAAGAAAWRLGRGALLQPVPLLLWAHLLLLVVYAALIVWSTNRISRGMVPVVWSAIGASAIAVRLVGPLRAEQRRWIAHAMAACVVISVAFLGYDLFIAFDGGRSYAAHAYQLGTFNHPLLLRELRGPDDMHVVIP